MDGFEILKRLREQPETAETPVILLTARSAEVDRVKGLEAGGDDYVVKPFGIMELQARVNAVMRRSRETRDEMVYRDLTICAGSRLVTRGEETLDLTYKEFELLTLLVRNRGRVLSREEILSMVWDYNYLGETRTVDMHIKSLRSKLSDEVRNPKYIVTIRGAGYKVN
jgi:two-component system alkaline phosphatase synthesis response regulator PhoP